MKSEVHIVVAGSDGDILADMTFYAVVQGHPSQADKIAARIRETEAYDYVRVISAPRYHGFYGFLIEQEDYLEELADDVEAHMEGIG